MSSAHTKKYLAIVSTATPRHIEEASTWYAEAQSVAEDVAENLNASLEQGASVVAALSPRERWSSNVAKALAFSMGKPVVGLSNNLTMAKASVELGFDALKGPKTNAFARAIAGDSGAVVIDTWMIRAAGMDPIKGINLGQYRDLSKSVVSVAKRVELTPRTTQALIWLIARGNA